MKTLIEIRPRLAFASLVLGLAATSSALAADLNVPADYPTIQAAVDAAGNGDRIRIAAGVYTGQVLISDKRLTLAGSAGTVLRAAPGMSQAYLALGPSRVPLLGILRSDVVVSGLAFEGGRLGDSQAGPFNGIFFYGSSGSVENCRITGFRGSTLADADYGVFAANPVKLGTGLVKVCVSRNTFADNVASIVLFGDIDPTLLRTTFTANDNAITGNGPDATGTQFGIWIWAGAGGEVKRNTITDHAYVGSTDPDPFSFGILAEDAIDFGVGPLAALQPIQFEGNNLRNNQLHMTLLRADGSIVVNNSFEGTAPGLRPTGILFSGDNVLVAANRFSGMPLGVLLLGDDPDFGTYLGLATNAQLLGNQFCRVTEPIVSEPLVTGTQEHGNRPNACQRAPHEKED